MVSCYLTRKYKTFVLKVVDDAVFGLFDDGINFLNFKQTGWSKLLRSCMSQNRHQTFCRLSQTLLCSLVGD